MYKRRTQWRDTSQPTRVFLHWSNKTGGYTLKWENTNHWNEMQPFISYLKTLPWGEYEYDVDTKTWGFTEKYLPQIQAMFDTLKPANVFDVDFQGKPDNQTNFASFISIDVYLDKFKNITGEDIKNKEYNLAKKDYRRACMRLHPDKGGDPKVMSELNECWLHIEQTHFKINKTMEQVV